MLVGRKTMVSAILLAFAGTSCTSDSQSELNSALHSASDDIEQSANFEAINSSLYSQMRSRVQVTDSELGSSQIDRKVRSYISERYTPVLVANYAQLYRALIGAELDFSNCENLTPIGPGEDVLQTLCVKEEGVTLRVQYMTNAYSQGWSTAAVFVFDYANSAATLSSIELQLNDDTGVHIEGL